MNTLLKAHKTQEIRSFNFIKFFKPINEIQMYVKLQLFCLLKGKKQINNYDKSMLKFNRHLGEVRPIPVKKLVAC